MWLPSSLVARRLAGYVMWLAGYLIGWVYNCGVVWYYSILVGCLFGRHTILLIGGF